MAKAAGFGASTIHRILSGSTQNAIAPEFLETADLLAERRGQLSRFICRRPRGRWFWPS
jgi:hypothetical protein